MCPPSGSLERRVFGLFLVRFCLSRSVVSLTQRLSQNISLPVCCPYPCSSPRLLRITEASSFPPKEPFHAAVVDLPWCIERVLLFVLQSHVHGKFVFSFVAGCGTFCPFLLENECLTPRFIFSSLWRFIFVLLDRQRVKSSPFPATSWLDLCRLEHPLVLFVSPPSLSFIFSTVFIFLPLSRLFRLPSLSPGVPADVPPHHRRPRVSPPACRD